MFILAMVLRRLKLKLGMEEIVVFPFNKHVVRVLGAPVQLLLDGCWLLIKSSCRRRGGGGEVGDEQLFGRSKGDQARLQFLGSTTSTPNEDLWPDVSEIALGRAHQQQRFIGSYAAHCGGRRAAFSGGYAALCSGRLAVFQPLLPLLVEWRPFYFLPASEPEGRQWLFIATSMVLHGSFVVPSDAVPGGGKVLVREKLWTRLLSPLGFRGPLCKRQGPFCNVLFSLGLSVRCTELVLIKCVQGPSRPFLCSKKNLGVNLDYI
jgi:hypothetical protein